MLGKYGNPTRVMLSLYNKKKLRIDYQDAEGSHPIKSHNLLPDFQTRASFYTLNLLARPLGRRILQHKSKYI